MAAAKRRAAKAVLLPFLPGVRLMGARLQLPTSQTSWWIPTSLPWLEGTAATIIIITLLPTA